MILQNHPAHCERYMSQNAIHHLTSKPPTQTNGPQWSFGSSDICVNSKSEFSYPPKLFYPPQYIVTLSKTGSVHFCSAVVFSLRWLSFIQGSWNLLKSSILGLYGGVMTLFKRFKSDCFSLDLEHFCLYT